MADCLEFQTKRTGGRVVDCSGLENLAGKAPEMAETADFCGSQSAQDAPFMDRSAVDVGSNVGTLIALLHSPRRLRHCIDRAAYLLPSPTSPVVYFVGGPEGHIKIGFATNLKDRLAMLQTGNPAPLAAFAYWPGDLALERRAHEVFADDRGNGEWFWRSPRLLRAVRNVQDALARPLGIRLASEAKPDDWSDLA